MSNVVQFSGITTQDHTPAQVLENLDTDNMEFVLVLSVNKKGERLTIHSASSEAAETLYWLQRAIHKMNIICDTYEEQE